MGWKKLLGDAKGKIDEIKEKRRLEKEEQERIDEFNRLRKRPKPTKVASKNEEGVKFEGKEEFWSMSAMEATGTSDSNLSRDLLTQASLTRPDANKELVDAINNTLVAMHGIAPQDTLEGLLVTQMIGSHNGAMEFMRKAMHENMPFEGTKEYILLSTKLMRTFTAQIETLNRYRSKGQQKVTVEHVHVNNGGQAIVGNVTGRHMGGVHEK